MFLFQQTTMMRTTKTFPKTRRKTKTMTILKGTAWAQRARESYPGKSIFAISSMQVGGVRTGGQRYGTTNTSAFSTNAKSRFASVVLYVVPRPLCQPRHSLRCPWFSVVLEATNESCRGPLKVAVSAQKVLQASATRELLKEQKRIVFCLPPP